MFSVSRSIVILGVPLLYHFLAFPHNWLECNRSGLRFFWSCACMSQAPLLLVQLPLQPFLASEAWMKHPILARTKTFSTGHIGLWNYETVCVVQLSNFPTIRQMIRHAQGAFCCSSPAAGLYPATNLLKLPSLLLRLPLRNPSFSCSFPWMVPCSIFRCRVQGVSCWW